MYVQHASYASHMYSNSYPVFKNISSLAPNASSDQHEPSSVTPPSYRLYKHRFAGAFAVFVLNVVAGMNWPWFGPIANSSMCSLPLKFYFSEIVVSH